jgi:hypothetical protein
MIIEDSWSAQLGVPGSSQRDQAAFDSFTHSGFKVGGWDQVGPGGVFFAGITRTRPVTR